MNRSYIIGFLGAALIASAFATNSVALVDGMKIGVIDLEKTLSETPAGKRANNQFETTRKKKQSELDKKQKELQGAAADLDKQAALMKPEVLKEKRAALEKQFVELQQTYMKLERDLAGERQKLLQGLLKQASPIVEEIAKEEGVRLIVDQAAAVWVDPAVDLTGKLNARMK